MAQFPGSKKVSAGEYELFNTLDSSQVISRAENEALTPGLNITMGILVAQYPSWSLDRCVRRGCKSDKFTSNESGGKIWYASHESWVFLSLEICELIELPKLHLQGLL